jgi:hypothetical protein
MSETFMSRVMKKSDKELIYFICGKHKGLWAWYYVRIEKLKHELFKHESKQGGFNINDYGIILASGYGDSPPGDIREKFEDAA